MATINYSLTPRADAAALVVKWETLTTTNADGSAWDGVSWGDRSVQVFGTWGAGGTLLIQGSNDGGTTWATLTDAQGTDLSFTADSFETVAILSGHIRPFVSAGDGTTDLDVHLLARSNKR